MSKLQLNGRDIEKFVFPGGEVHTKFDDVALQQIKNQDKLIIKAHLESSDDVFALLNVFQSIRDLNISIPIDLDIPYIPYGRQDRKTSEIEPFSLKVFAGIINTMDYNSIRTVDPHSNVTPALFRNMHIYVPHMEIFRTVFRDNNRNHVLIVVPDLGASKRVDELAKYLDQWIDPEYQSYEIIQSTKHRDPATGYLSKCKVYFGDVDFAEYDSILIPDDVADGCNTFLNLAKEIKKYTDLPIDLYCTHGIFSKGKGVLKDYFANVNSLYQFDKYKDLP